MVGTTMPNVAVELQCPDGRESCLQLVLPCSLRAAPVHHGEVGEYMVSERRIAELVGKSVVRHRLIPGQRSHGRKESLKARAQCSNGRVDNQAINNLIVAEGRELDMSPVSSLVDRAGKQHIGRGSDIGDMIGVSSSMRERPHVFAGHAPRCVAGVGDRFHCSNASWRHRLQAVYGVRPQSTERSVEGAAHSGQGVRRRDVVPGGPGQTLRERALDSQSIVGHKSIVPPALTFHQLYVNEQDLPPEVNVPETDYTCWRTCWNE